MAKKTAIQELQDRLYELFDARAHTDRTIKTTELLLDEARREKNALAKAKRLAAKHGIEIERDDGDYWVTHPFFVDTPEDPCEGGHFCVGGTEVLNNVETYVAALAKLNGSKP